MSALDVVLDKAYRMRAGYRSLRELFGDYRREREKGLALAQIGKNLLGNHMDAIADSRDRVRGARIGKLREYLVGPRPERRIITAEEFERQKEIARELLNCDDPNDAIRLCDQALQESIGLIERHDTMDVLEDVEPLLAVALDAHEQVIAWYESANLRMPYAEWKKRQAEGAPSLVQEFIASNPTHVVGQEVGRTNERGEPEAPQPPAVYVPTIVDSQATGEVPAVSSNPTADPT